MSCPSEIAQLSDDERRKRAYDICCSVLECRLFLEEVYEISLDMMRGRPFGDCEDALVVHTSFHGVPD